MHQHAVPAQELEHPGLLASGGGDPDDPRTSASQSSTRRPDGRRPPAEDTRDSRRPDPRSFARTCGASASNPAARVLTAPPQRYVGDQAQPPQARSTRPGSPAAATQPSLSCADRQTWTAPPRQKVSPRPAPASVVDSRSPSSRDGNRRRPRR